MYLDDDFGCNSTKGKTEHMAKYIYNDILSSVFVPKDENRAELQCSAFGG